MTPEEFHQHQIAEHSRGRKTSKPMPLFETMQGNKIKELEKLLEDIKTDLLLRADEDSKGFTVVNLSQAIYSRLKKATKQ
jgi:hypothetical protein